MLRWENGLTDFPCLLIIAINVYHLRAQVRRVGRRTVFVITNNFDWTFIESRYMLSCIEYVNRMWERFQMRVTL